MKYLMQILTVALLSCLVCISCKKTDQSPYFEGRSAIAISGDLKQGVLSDSLAFSFGTINSAIEDTLIRIVVRAVGETSNQERAFKLGINQQLSNALPAEYELPTSFVIPANSTGTTLRLKIKKTERLKDAVARLVLEVEANDQFIPAPRLELKDMPVSGPRFTLSWTSLLTKPAAWDSFPPGAGFIFVFGEYSRTKHQLIIDATGIATYDDVTFFSSEWTYIYHKASAWLNAYNAAHPGAPLRDENGLVEFTDF
ncbi:DUF4843 domain-containing protein [Pedobacter sp. AW31-3R]|uniref:DUF4843 domain-containing protein n=1 Tax=Pedobacter sp. AW31-3R TaxID=3445781 RepID=UPI003F9ED16C